MKSGKIKVKTLEKIFLIFNVFSFFIITGEVSGKILKIFQIFSKISKKEKTLKIRKSCRADMAGYS